MEKHNSIIQTKNYGKISLFLKEVMDSKGISRNSLARSINVRFEVIDRWYNSNLEKLDLDILARICFVLECDITDIIKYEK